MTLDVLSLGLMIPVLPNIVLGFMDGDTAGAAKVFGRGHSGRRGSRKLGCYETVASRRPVGVSLHTSQSGFSGLLNQGSVQPRSRQRRTIASATA